MPTHMRCAYPLVCTPTCVHTPLMHTCVRTYPPLCVAAVTIAAGGAIVAAAVAVASVAVAAGGAIVVATTAL